MNVGWHCYSCGALTQNTLSTKYCSLSCLFLDCTFPGKGEGCLYQKKAIKWGQYTSALNASNIKRIVYLISTNGGAITPVQVCMSTCNDGRCITPGHIALMTRSDHRKMVCELMRVVAQDNREKRKLIPDLEKKAKADLFLATLGIENIELYTHFISADKKFVLLYKGIIHQDGKIKL